MVESNVSVCHGAILSCVVSSTGIIVALSIYGLLQERLMTLEYGVGLFAVAVLLVFLNRLAAFLLGVCIALCSGEDFSVASLLHAAPLWKYALISVSNVFASFCQYQALKYVSFPVQMIGKSFKIMPVMLWGVAVGGKIYSLKDWFFASVVTAGVAEFLMTGPISSTGATGTSGIGLWLLVCFLAFDGFTSSYQEVLFTHHKTSRCNQMMYVNLGSLLVASVAVQLTMGLGSAVELVMRPHFLVDATTLSASAALGQWFIYTQVQQFGAVVFAGTMTLRQVVSVSLSYITYGHSSTPLQALGIVVVFTALFARVAHGTMFSTETDEEKKPLV